MKAVDSRPRFRAREHGVLVAALASALALVWAGSVLQGDARTAGEVAVARLASGIADTVLAEWERVLRSPELPVEPAGVTFRWRAAEPPLAPLEVRERLTSVDSGDELSLSRTLLAEAERRELVEGDPAAALELVLEALEKEPASALRLEGLLRAIQLASRTGDTQVAREHWALLRAEADARDARRGLPYIALGRLALPAELAHGIPAGALFDAATLERLFAADDRLRFEPASVELELAPLLVELLARLGLEQPPTERRSAAALARAAGTLPSVPDDGRWHLLVLAGREFLARVSGEGHGRNEVHGAFFEPGALTAALARRAALPDGFALDFGGEDGASGEQVRARTPLPESELGFVLRHEDPQRIAREESGRLALLRASLFVLAACCAGGGFLTARVLRRERKLAELKQAFVAGVSHDLRTPLAAILLLADNLESGRADEEKRGRYHSALRREAERLRRLVDDVLDFSRLERGREPELELEERALEPFVAELAAEARARVEAAGRRFAPLAGPLPASGTLDPSAVRRALDNLIDNALKHGAGEVRLGWRADGARLWLTVGDEGPGVPPARAAAVFRPFERFATNGHVGGAGLGLAIVRSIARRHGGDVRLVRDGAEKGATFELELDLEAHGA